MNPDDLPQELVGAFAEAVLTPTDMPQRERRLRERLSSLGRYPEALVQAQSSEALAQALKHGFFFAETQEEFYIRFEPLIRTWLVKWGLPYHPAFDLAQHLLWRCLRNRLRRYNAGQGKVNTYMKRAAFNLWIEKVIRARKAILPDADRLAGDDSDALDAAIAQELEEQVRHALPGLSPEQRAAVVLVMKGKSPDEIAEELGFALVSRTGLATVLEDTDSEAQSSTAISLTWNGRELTEPAGSHTVWDKVKAEAKERGGSMPSAIIKALALKVAAFLFGLG